MMDQLTDDGSAEIYHSTLHCKIRYPIALATGDDVIFPVDMVHVSHLAPWVSLGPSLQAIHPLPFLTAGRSN